MKDKSKKTLKKPLFVALCLVWLLGLGAYFVYQAQIEEAQTQTLGTAEMIREIEENVDFTLHEMNIYLLHDASLLEGKKALSACQNTGIYYDGTLLASAKDGTLYLTQSMDTNDWAGAFSVTLDGYVLCGLLDDPWQGKLAAMEEGTSYTLYLVGEKNYYTFHMVVSGLPIITMDIAYEEEVSYDADEDQDLYYLESGTRYHGTITVFDPGDEDREREITSSDFYYVYKGATSATFAKKSYSIKLLDEEGEKRNCSFLGLRSDNSWKLNALFTDSTMVREVTAAQIWAEFADAASDTLNESGPVLSYVEVILDGEYQGVYALVEPVDRKKLALDDEDDVLYKIVGWAVPEDESILFSVERGWRIYTSIRIKWPNEITDSEHCWWPIRDFLNTFYRSNALDYTDATSKVTMENLYDIFLFLNVTSASDNYYKNLYFAADCDGDASYAMRIVPWDLDYTFGNVYQSGVTLSTVFDADYTYLYDFTPLREMLDAFGEEFADALLERFKTYRESFLNTDAILSMFQENADLLTKSGAYKRESAAWSDYERSADLDALMEYTANRLDWLDAYMEEYCAR